MEGHLLRVARPFVSRSSTRSCQRRSGRGQKRKRERFDVGFWTLHGWKVLAMKSVATTETKQRGNMTYLHTDCFSDSLHTIGLDSSQLGPNLWVLFFCFFNVQLLLLKHKSVPVLLLRSSDAGLLFRPHSGSPRFYVSTAGVMKLIVVPLEGFWCGYRFVFLLSQPPDLKPAHLVAKRLLGPGDPSTLLWLRLTHTENPSDRHLKVAVALCAWPFTFSTCAAFAPNRKVELKCLISFRFLLHTEYQY